MHADPEIRLDGLAVTKTPDGTLGVECEGLSVWVGYSGHTEYGNMAWFDYCEGNIKVKNPDQEILKKMLSMARPLGAKVQGEDSEVYDGKGQSRWQNSEMQDAVGQSAKCWQFWK